MQNCIPCKKYLKCDYFISFYPVKFDVCNGKYEYVNLYNVNHKYN